MDGCSGFSPDHHTASISNIQLAADCDHPGNQRIRGAIRTGGHSKKAAATPTRAAAAVFPQQKTTESVLADSCVFPHLSSSSDLRIISSVRPSQETPNDQLSLSTKPSRIQRRYRPGFSPGFLFSCSAVTASAGTQMEYLPTHRIPLRRRIVNRNLWWGYRMHIVHSSAGASKREGR